MSTYADFVREPSKPHQCMHESDKDGHRCRATAMHNEYMCFHHRCEDIPTVIQNDPFLVETLHTRDAILHTLSDIAARLASNRIDLKRAALLIQTCQSAASSLTAQERQAATAARTAATKPGAPCSTQSFTASTMGLLTPEPQAPTAAQAASPADPAVDPEQSTPPAPADNPGIPTEVPSPAPYPSPSPVILTPAEPEAWPVTPEDIADRAQTTNNRQPATPDLQLPPRYTTNTHDPHPRMAS
jgi:hypothetical protein